MSDSGPSKGRARGKVRSVDQSSQGRPGQSQGSRGPRGSSQARGPVPTSAPPPQGAWGPRPGGGPAPVVQPAPPSAWGPRPPQAQAYQQRVPAPASTPAQAGRASIRQSDTRGVIVEEPERIVVGPGGDAGNTAGRGSTRGRRQMGYEVQPLITRPANLGSKQGKTGKPVRLSANYFELITPKDWCLYQYRVDFAPEVDVTTQKKKLLASAIKDTLSGYLFDGTVLFTPRRISPNPLELFIEDTTGTVRITIRLVGDVAQGDYQLLQFFNIVIRKCLSFMRLQLVGRNYYDPASKIQISEYGIELWPGYVTSIRQHESKILLCCEISHKFMRKENVFKILTDFVRTDRTNYKHLFTKLMIGSVVLTDYNNRTYRIDDIDWDVSPSSTFQRRDGSSISYIQYYQERYNIKIREKEQPMLVSRAKAREIRAGMSEIIYLVPELCRLTGLTEAERSNMQMMRALATHTRLSPDGRKERLEKYSQRMNTTKEIIEELKRWDLKLTNKIVEFPGRVIQQEMICQGPQGSIKYPSGEETEWSRNLRSNPMIVIGKVNLWVCIVANNLKNDAYSFCQNLSKAAGGMSFKLPQPKLVAINDDRPSTYVLGLEEALQYKPTFVLCVVSNQSSDRYSAIKKKCCVEKAIPTQVVLKKNLVSKGVMSIATKVAIQINCKIGGAPWTIEMPLSGLMVVGFDACHDTMNKQKSYGAMVASLDKQCCRYYTAVSAHSNGEELSNDFALNIIKSVRSYLEVNSAIPEKIIIYRDGVGDGQLPYVHSHEVARILEQLKIFYKDKPVKLAFIVVTKRINTRIFDGSRNPLPGTVVDDVITLPQRYDFFIVSQCVRQGTVSPTSYNVIHDTLGLDPDKIQRLTYKFTHMYYNWSGTVRVPAPCQYAHKLAFLVSQSLHRNPNPQLDSTLYFL